MPHNVPGVPEITPAHVEAMEPFVIRVIADVRAEANRLEIHEEAGATTIATMIAGRMMAELTGPGVGALTVEMAARLMGNAVYQAVIVEHAALYAGGERE